jgi:hypothetical protein
MSSTAPLTHRSSLRLAALTCAVTLPHLAVSQAAPKSDSKPAAVTTGKSGTDSTKRDSARTGAREIAVDLTTGRVSDVLPFDEPFVLRVRHLEPRVLSVEVGLKSTNDYRDAAPRTCREKGVVQSAIPPTYLGDSVALVVVPPIPANRYYRICVWQEFRPSASLSAAIRDSLPKEVAIATRDLGERFSNGLTQREVASIQQSLVAAARRLRPRDEISLDSGIAPNSLSRPLAYVRQYDLIDSIRILDKNRRNVLGTIRQRHELNDALVAMIRDSAGVDLALHATSTSVPAVSIAATSSARALPVAAWAAAEVDPAIRLLQDSVAKLKTIISLRYDTRLTGDSTLQRRFPADTVTLILGHVQAQLTETRALQDLLTQREQHISALSALLLADTPPETSLRVANGASIADLVTRTRQHVGIDLGVSALPRIGRAAGYVGAAFYFVPVNDRVPLSMQPGVLGGFFKRPSIGVGLTTSAFNAPDRADLFGGGSLLVDVGLRPWDALRLSAGCMLYRKTRDVVTEATSLGCEPSFSIGINDAVKEVFSALFTRLGLTGNSSGTQTSENR